jgi:hypothetical protein
MVISSSLSVGFFWVYPVGPGDGFWENLGSRKHFFAAIQMDKKRSDQTSVQKNFSRLTSSDIELQKDLF